MKKLATMTSMLAATALLGFSISSCTTETTTPGTGTGTGPTNIAANSGSSSSINVRWDRQTSDVTGDTVVAMANGVVAQTAYASSTSNTATLTGLQPNVMYTISVRSTAGTSSSITWMTAARSNTIRLYETADNASGQYSGLSFNGGSPQAISVSGGASGRQNADLVLASDPNSPGNATHLSLVAGSVTSLSGLDFGKNTRISKVQNSVAGGLDAVYYTGDLSTLIPTTTADTVNAFDIPATTGANPVVMEVKTGEVPSHFARVEIVPQSNGQLYGGTPGQNYIDVVVSYQTTPDAPYASRPHPVLLTNESKHTFHN